MRILLGFFIACIFIPQAWAGANTLPDTHAPIIKGDFSLMKHTTVAKVDKVIDAQTVLMKDGKIVRLLGIDYPFEQGGDITPETLAAKERLEKLLKEGSDVILWQSRNSKTGRMNRMGHILAHLETKKDGRWINGTLIDEGHAWVMTDWSNADMADQMYALEKKARAEEKGLWSKDSRYGLLTPETASAGDGSFRVVEGIVNRSATSKNNLYLNFGSDMRKDFTVRISPALRKQLAREGVDPMNLSGQHVRVRGWIREWNGPFMELESAERLEILPTQKPTDLSTEQPTLSPEPSPAPAISGQLNP